MSSGPDNSFHICGELLYEEVSGNVHSDICMNVENDFVKEVDKIEEREVDGEKNIDTYRKFWHRALDEWIDRSGGHGFFWVGRMEDMIENFKD